MTMRLQAAAAVVAEVVASGTTIPSGSSNMRQANDNNNNNGNDNDGNSGSSLQVNGGHLSLICVVPTSRYFFLCTSLSHSLLLLLLPFSPPPPPLPTLLLRSAHQQIPQAMTGQATSSKAAQLKTQIQIHSLYSGRMPRYIDTYMYLYLYLCVYVFKWAHVSASRFSQYALLWRHKPAATSFSIIITILMPHSFMPHASYTHSQLPATSTAAAATAAADVYVPQCMYVKRCICMCVCLPKLLLAVVACSHRRDRVANALKIYFNITFTFIKIIIQILCFLIRNLY